MGQGQAVGQVVFWAEIHFVMSEIKTILLKHGKFCYVACVLQMTGEVVNMKK